MLVEGKQAGKNGEVAEIMEEMPSSRQAGWILRVTEAYNVTLTEYSVSDDPDDLLPQFDL